MLPIDPLHMTSHAQSASLWESKRRHPIGAISTFWVRLSALLLHQCDAFVWFLKWHFAFSTGTVMCKRSTCHENISVNLRTRLAWHSSRQEMLGNQWYGETSESVNCNSTMKSGPDQTYVSATSHPSLTKMVQKNITNVFANTMATFDPCYIYISNAKRACRQSICSFCHRGVKAIHALALQERMRMF